MVPQLAHCQYTTQVSGGICSVVLAPQMGQVSVAVFSGFMVIYDFRFTIVHPVIARS